MNIILILGGGPPEECKLSEEKERHLDILRANDLMFDNPNDPESDSFNRYNFQMKKHKM